MKAYQVFKGEQDKHGRQIYDLVATYLDKEKALAHCRQIVESTTLYGDVLEEGEFYGEGKYKSWDAIGWERVTIAQFTEIDITE
jgi:hypothetical protein